jgi:rod shape-determining protein MreC
MNFSNNFSINKKSNSLLKILAGLVCLLVLIFVLNLLNNPIKNLFFAFSSPMQKTFWSAGESSSGFLSSVLNSVNLAQENDRLNAENQKLIAQVTLLKSINNANQAQSDVSLACQNKNFKLLMAGVVGLDGPDIISINKGLSDGVLEGMPVINQQNVVFGTIYKVYKNYSQVMLISNKKSIINVKVGDINGVVKGIGSSGIYLDLVPVESNLVNDDILITSALEKTLPPDLLVGRITQVQKNDQKPFQQAKVQPFFDLSSADNLFVITNYKQPK